MYRIRQLFTNLSEFFLNSFYKPLDPATPKDEDMEQSLPSNDCDCIQEGWKVVTELLNNEDAIWLLFISGFFVTLSLWVVTTWLDKLQKQANNRPYKVRKPYKIRRRNLPPLPFDQTSEDEIIIKSKDANETDNVEEPAPQNTLIIGDHIDENSQNLSTNFHPDGQPTQQIPDSAETFTKSRKRDKEVSLQYLSEVSLPPSIDEKIKIKEEKPFLNVPSPIIVSEEKKTTPTSMTLKPSKSPGSSETSSIKGRNRKSCPLRVDPLEYRNKRLKKNSPRDLNVAFGSRLSISRIGDSHRSLSTQVSPSMTPPRYSMVRTSTNLSLISSEKRPYEEKGNIQEAKEDQNSSSSSEKSIK